MPIDYDDVPAFPHNHNDEPVFVPASVYNRIMAEQIASHVGSCVLCDSQLSRLYYSPDFYGGKICGMCFDDIRIGDMDFAYRCGCCSHLFMRQIHEPFVLWDGKEVCPECYHNDGTHCEACDGRIVHGMNVWSSPIGTVCQSCYEATWWRCEWCLESFELPAPRDVHQCNRCRDRHVIGGYHQSASTRRKFFGYGNTYLGIELEVEAPRDWDYDSDEKPYFCRKLKDIFPRGEIFFEHDGSLDNGVEIITEPMSFPYFWRNQGKFALMLDRLQNGGWRSHNGGRCGLHVHVSKKAFGERAAEQDDKIAALIWITENYWDEIKKLSRRGTGNRINEWSGRHHIDSKEGAKHTAKYKGDGERYHAVNIVNHRTVEFRFFRGTLMKESFFASIAFIEALVKLANDIHIDELDEDMSLYDIMKPYTNRKLRRYMKARGVV